MKRELKLTPEFQAKLDDLDKRMSAYTLPSDDFTREESNALDEAFAETIESVLEPFVYWFKRFGNAFFMLVPNSLISKLAVKWYIRLKAKSSTAASKVLADLNEFPAHEFEEFVPSLAIQLYKDVVTALNDADFA